MGVEGVFGAHSRIANSKTAKERDAQSNKNSDAEEEKKEEGTTRCKPPTAVADDVGHSTYTPHPFDVVSDVRVSVSGQLQGVHIRRLPFARAVTPAVVRRLAMRYSVVLSKPQVAHATAFLLRYMSVRGAQQLDPDGGRTSTAPDTRASMMRDVHAALQREQLGRGATASTAAPTTAASASTAGTAFGVLPENVLSFIATGHPNSELDRLREAPWLKQPAAKPRKELGHVMLVRGVGPVPVLEEHWPPMATAPMELLPSTWRADPEVVAAFELWLRRVLLRPYRGMSRHAAKTTPAGVLPPWRTPLRWWEAMLVRVRLYTARVWRAGGVGDHTAPARSDAAHGATAAAVLEVARRNGKLSRLRPAPDADSGAAGFGPAPRDGAADTEPCVVHLEVEVCSVAHTRRRRCHFELHD